MSLTILAYIKVDAKIKWLFITQCQYCSVFLRSFSRFIFLNRFGAFIFYHTLYCLGKSHYFFVKPFFLLFYAFLARFQRIRFAPIALFLADVNEVPLCYWLNYVIFSLQLQLQFVTITTPFHFMFQNSFRCFFFLWISFFQFYILFLYLEKLFCNI